MKEIICRAGLEKNDREQGYGKGDKAVNEEQTDKRKMWMEKKKLVTFIAGVINKTSDIKSKIERIQISSSSGYGRVEMGGNK